MVRRRWLICSSGMLLVGLLYGVAAAVDTPPTIPEATHQQVKVLKPTSGDSSLKLTAFCLNKEGNVVALVNHVVPPKPVQAKPRIRLQLKAVPKAIEKKPADEKSAEVKKSPVSTAISRALTAVVAQAATTAETTDEGQQTETATVEIAEPRIGNAEVRILDPEGNIVAQWPVEFEGQAINIDADGNIIVAGDGFLARYDVKGKEIAKAEAPQIAKMAKTDQELQDQAREALQGRAAPMEEALKALEKQKAELADKKDEDLTDAERQQKTRLDSRINSYKRSIENFKLPKEAQVKMMAQQLAGRTRKINAVAASDKYLFVTCGDPKGFGYSVWRTDADFKNPKQIVGGLSGCCGQMDVQCCGDELVVAENSRKRVVRYDAEGKEVAKFGKASRDGAGDTFGSCCNPMNTRLHDGKLLVSDSDGRVRLFTLDGKYEGEVGKADVRAGCKSSTVDISADGNRLYYIDVNTSQICVLDRKPADNNQVSVQ